MRSRSASNLCALVGAHLKADIRRSLETIELVARSMIPAEVWRSTFDAAKAKPTAENLEALGATFVKHVES